MRTTSLVSVTVCAATATLFSSAWAQVDGRAADPAGNPAHNALEEIVVTAQKRSQNLSKVPISITALSAEALQDTGAGNLTALQGVVPGITLPANSSYGQSVISIRGTSGAGNNLQDDPVAVYVDGVYYASNQAGIAALSDIEGIEIARGPQGTLQGRNSTAGAILIRTADPDDELGGYLRASMATPLEHRAEAAISVPLSNTLKARLAVDHHHQEGWAENRFTGNHLGGQDALNVRSTFLFEPTDTLWVRLKLNYQDVTHRAASARWAALNLNPGPGAAQAAPSPGVLPLADYQGMVFDHDTVNLNVEPESTIKLPSLALETRYDLGWSEVVSVTGLYRSDNRGTNDSDGLALDRQAWNKGHISGRFASEELRLQSGDDQRLTWLTGLYASSLSERLEFDIYNLQFTQPINTVAQFRDRQTTKSLAGFADATWQMTDRLSVTGGVRYTAESKVFRGKLSVVNLGTGAFVANPPYATPPEATWKKFSYRGKLAYELADDTLLYASYSTGYHSGGYNAFSPNGPVYAPEELKSAELGVKSYFLQRRAYLAASIYDNKYENMQVSSGVPTGGFVVANAASSKSQGFEIEGQIQPVEHLALSANVAYADAKFEDFKRAQSVLTPTPVDASGNRLPRAPKWQYYVHGTFDFDFGADWHNDFQVSWRWRGEQYFTAADQNLATLQGPAAGELGARLSFSYVPSDLTLTVFGTNLTNERVVSSEQLTVNHPLAFFNEPRVVGLQVEKEF